jgi:phage portal protein BeeE
LHGVRAADFSSDELLYLPRNVRSHRLYGLSPVEQIALTVNIALRRDKATLDYYRAGPVALPLAASTYYVRPVPPNLPDP